MKEGIEEMQQHIAMFKKLCSGAITISGVDPDLFFSIIVAGIWSIKDENSGSAVLSRLRSVQRTSIDSLMYCALGDETLKKLDGPYGPMEMRMYAEQRQGMFSRHLLITWVESDKAISTRPEIVEALEQSLLLELVGAARASSGDKSM